jgi:hypothetical protein
MSRSSWGVVVATLFAIATWATPVPERWRALLVFLAWAVLGFACIGWLAAHLKWTCRLRSAQAATRPMTLIIIGVVGGLLAVSAWLLVPKLFAEDESSNQPKPESSATAQPIQEEVKVEEPKPNLIPVGYRKLHVVFDPATQTFKEGDNGILTLVALFSNEHERGKQLSEAEDIRARISFEPSEYYEKLGKGIKDAEKSTTGFASVREGIWLNEKQSVVNFSRGETKTLIIAVQMQDDLGFGSFDAFEHSTATRNGREIYLPKIPKLTADKYVVKVVLSGGARGDIDELYHFTVTLRPEFNISF